jgi:hypothetical protein
MQHSLTGGAPSPRPWDRPGVLGAGAVRSAGRAAGVAAEAAAGIAQGVKKPYGPADG